MALAIFLFTLGGVALLLVGYQLGLTTSGHRRQAVEIDKAAAASFPGGLPAYQAYQQQQAVNEAIKSGKVQVLPVPAGSPVIVNQGK